MPYFWPTNLGFAHKSMTSRVCITRFTATLSCLLTNNARFLCRQWWGNTVVLLSSERNSRGGCNRRFVSVLCTVKKFSKLT